MSPRSRCTRCSGPVRTVSYSCWAICSILRSVSSDSSCSRLSRDRPSWSSWRGERSQLRRGPDDWSASPQAPPGQRGSRGRMFESRNTHLRGNIPLEAEARPEEGEGSQLLSQMEEGAGRAPGPPAPACGRAHTHTHTSVLRAGQAPSSSPGGMAEPSASGSTWQPGLPHPRSG